MNDNGYYFGAQWDSLSIEGAGAKLMNAYLCPGKGTQFLKVQFKTLNNFKASRNQSKNVSAIIRTVRKMLLKVLLGAYPEECCEEKKPLAVLMTSFSFSKSCLIRK